MSQSPNVRISQHEEIRAVADCSPASRHPGGGDQAGGDDSNLNLAKYRDGTQHFATPNRRRGEAGEPWRYHFYFLSPEDYTGFFDQVHGQTFAGWKSGLMRGLGA
jgi:hypothetical protein